MKKYTNYYNKNSYNMKINKLKEMQYILKTLNMSNHSSIGMIEKNINKIDKNIRKKLKNLKLA